MGNDSELLTVRDLTVKLATDGGSLEVLSRVGFDVPRGKVVGLMGESGSGKSITALSIVRLLPEIGSAIRSGTVMFDGVDLTKLSERELEKIRGKQIGFVFQDPLASLNPVYRVGSQIVEAIRLHEHIPAKAARVRAIELLRRVGVPQPEERVDAYPHELSGGLRQRVMIAVAIACSPALVIADEPTSALDMVTQRQIVLLFRDLVRTQGMSLLIIAHDPALLAELSDELVVMYAGQVVEHGPAKRVLEKPAHPYTMALLRSVLPADFGAVVQPRSLLPVVEGHPPDLRRVPLGCRFQPRCDSAFDDCATRKPHLMKLPLDQGEARCLLLGDKESSP
ncbi:MAG: ABC transporter ATP-binding protein [Polyangiaceae bacterium]|nr:ABC transporter ATP-binding protein [Polyangiaceae bacterium]